MGSRGCRPDDGRLLTHADGSRESEKAERPDFEFVVVSGPVHCSRCRLLRRNAAGQSAIHANRFQQSGIRPTGKTEATQRQRPRAWHFDPRHGNGKTYSALFDSSKYAVACFSHARVRNCRRSSNESTRANRRKRYGTRDTTYRPWRLPHH